MSRRPAWHQAPRVPRADASWRRSRCSGRSTCRPPSGGCRSARPRTVRGAGRCSQPAPRWAPLPDLAVELRGRGGLQDLVDPTQLADLTLKLNQPLRVVGCGARPNAAVDLGLADPVPQHFGTNPEPVGNPLDGTSRKLLRVLPGIHHHPHHPLLELHAVLPQCHHDSHSSFPELRAPTSPGAIQTPPGLNSRVDRTPPPTGGRQASRT